MNPNNYSLKSFGGVKLTSGLKADRTMRWLSDSNLSVKNISPFFQVGSTVKWETSNLFRVAKVERLFAAKKAFCKKLKLGLTTKQIKDMSYSKIRALGMIALIKAKKNVCTTCGGTIDNLLEGMFKSTRLYHYMCNAKEEDQRRKRFKQIQTLLWLHNHKEKRVQDVDRKTEEQHD